MSTHEIHWFEIVRDVVMLVIGIALASSRPGTDGPIWQRAIGWILIAMVIADLAIIVS